MSQVPPLALQIKCNSVPSSYQTTVSGNTISIATFGLIKKQTFSNSSTFDLTHIRKGDWVVSTSAAGAPCWRVFNISGTPTSANNSTVDLLLEDVGNYNKKLDVNGVGGIFTNHRYIAFRLNADGMPELSGVYKQLDAIAIPDKNFLADVVARFATQSVQRQCITIRQPSHGLTVGTSIFLNESGVYVASSETTATKTLGVVSEVGVPNADWFSFKAFGTFYLDTSRFFSGLSLATYGGPGTYLYLHANASDATTAGTPYTTTPPGNWSLPIWVYLGTDPTRGTVMGMLFSNNYPVGGGSGSPGATGAQGATGSTGAQGAQGSTGSFGGFVNEDILPSVTDTYSIGSSTYRFKEGHFQDVFVSANTIHVGNSGASISSSLDGNSLVLPLGSSLQGVPIGSISIKGQVDTPQDLPTGAILGDAYIIGIHLYICKTEPSATLSDWTNIGEIRGPVGAQGNQGFQGVPGVNGLNGGAQGATGMTGAPGAQGDVGAQGDTGAQGAQGAQGDTGAQGAQGVNGVGSTGAQGAQGFQGVIGAQGAQGVNGVGSTGAQGAQGFQGVIGAQGAQGFQGVPATMNNSTFTGTTSIDRLHVNEVSEGITTATWTSNAATVDYGTSALYYLSISGTPTTNITLTVNSLPSITESSRIYVMTVIYPQSGSRYVASVIYRTGTSGGTTTVTPMFPSTPALTGTTGLVVQQIIFIYQNAAMNVISNVTKYGT